jgi:hypothetical protein
MNDTPQTVDDILKYFEYNSIPNHTKGILAPQEVKDEAKAQLHRLMLDVINAEKPHCPKVIRIRQRIEEIFG